MWKDYRVSRLQYLTSQSTFRIWPVMTEYNGDILHIPFLNQVQIHTQKIKLMEVKSEKQSQFNFLGKRLL